MTVVRLMFSLSAISLLIKPLTTNTSTSISRGGEFVFVADHVRNVIRLPGKRRLSLILTRMSVLAQLENAFHQMLFILINIQGRHARQLRTGFPVHQYDCPGLALKKKAVCSK